LAVVLTEDVADYVYRWMWCWLLELYDENDKHRL